MAEHTNVIFDMKTMLKRFNIDTDRWVGKTFKEKIEYLKSHIKPDDRIDFAENMSKLADALFCTLRNSGIGKVAQSYVSLVETAFNLFRINYIVKNTFVAEQYEYRGRFDDLARALGGESDCEITSSELKTSGEMCRFLLNMSKEIQDRFDLHVSKIKNLLNTNDDDTDGYRLRSVVVFSHGGIQYAMMIENYASDKADLGSDNEDFLEGSYSEIRLATMNDNYDDDKAEDAVHALYSAYISNVDLGKYMFSMDNVMFTRFKRNPVGFDVRNIDVDRMRLAIDRSLKHGKSRGFLIEGEPGVGKTISVKKVLEGLPQYPVFWVPLAAISEASLDHTFTTLERIDKSIIVFDDIEGLFKGEKDAYSSDFIGFIDDLREEPGGHIVIIIVNEPQRLHNTLRMRPGRIDEVIVVTAPQDVNEVADVIKQRFVVAAESMPGWATLDNPEFVEICQGLVDEGITQAYIAGIVSDLLTFYDGECTIENFRLMVDGALKSRENSMLVAGSDGRLCSAQMVQPTAMSGLSGEL